jgi:hypothetical protein
MCNKTVKLNGENWKTKKKKFFRIGSRFQVLLGKSNRPVEVLTKFELKKEKIFSNLPNLNFRVDLKLSKSY